MKAPKVADPIEVPFKVWCERCSIRIAPNEERVSVRDKMYHATCHSKLVGVSKAKA